MARLKRLAFRRAGHAFRIKKTLDSIVDYRVYTEGVMIPQNKKTIPRTMKIGEVASRSGVGVEALRFYESRGLLEPAGRTEAGYRLYDDTVLDRIEFIKKAQTVGFNLQEIAKIVDDAKHGLPCAEVRKLAAEKLAELDRRLAELKRCRKELKETVDAWERVGEKEGMICGLIEGLAPPDKNSQPSARMAFDNRKRSRPRRS